ncbi:phosphonate metabolism transcriptional regulator PhnF [Pseudooceanicola sp. C21-150M6]|uniref:phosphonate metabolism transcriptional regulator PhnF n=1 Tax=Pseudooceanicola sp. C21-150M6 TaxID=3434355 RepID=UPI003D7FF8FF
MNKRLNIDSVDPATLDQIRALACKPYGSRGERAVWLQICDRLGEACTTGPLQAGTRLPGENDLAEMFDVSRLTIRKALSKLQQEGQLQARKGVGIFVRNIPARYTVADNLRFSQSLDAAQARIETRTLSLGPATAGIEAARALGLKPGAPVIRLHRVRIVDGAPAYLTTKDLPAARFPEFDARYRPRQSIADVYAGHGIAAYARTETRVTGGFASREEAEALQLTPRTPLIIVKSVNCDPEGVPVEFSIGRWPLTAVELVFGRASLDAD